MNFNWDNFNEETYNNVAKAMEERPYNLDCVGHVHVGDISIELIVDTFYNEFDELETGILYDMYVAHEDTGYGYKNEYGYDYLGNGMPYDYADGGILTHPKLLTYEQFKEDSERRFVEFITKYDECKVYTEIDNDPRYVSYSLVEHANRPLEIW